MTRAVGGSDGLAARACPDRGRRRHLRGRGREDSESPSGGRARRLGRATLALAALLSFLAPEGQVGAASAASPQCDFLAEAPYESEDRAVLCGRILRDPTTLVPLAFETSASHDGGKTWLTRNSAGLLMSYTTLFFQLLASADFVHDHTWFLLAFDLGVYKSTDDGATWSVADPVATQPSTWPALAAIKTTVGQVGTGALTYADPGRQGAGSALIVPPLHTPIAGTADYTVMYATAPPAQGPYSGMTFALAVHPGGTEATNTTRVFACNVALSCSDLRFESPPYYSVSSGLFMADDFAKSGRIAVWVRHNRTRRYSLFFSQDGGRHFALWRDLQRVLDQSQWRAPNERLDLGVTFSPRDPRLMFVRMHFQNSPGVARPEQVWRTTDGGRTWQLAGSSAPAGRTGVRGTLPWIYSVGEIPEWLQAQITADSRGNLLVLGYTPRGTAGNFVWCSRDNAHTWQRTC